MLEALLGVVIATMHRFFLLHLVTFGITLHFVQVAATGNGDIRLKGGNYSSGRVEIYYNGAWGTICDDNWDMADANVVCRQLGFGPADVAHRYAFYGEGTGPVLLDEVQCSGYEERLDLCSSNGWYNHDCSHREDAGVQCSEASSPPYVTLRLAGSNSPQEGRVEIYYDNKWGTICDDFWEYNDALVVCRQLGFSAVAAFYSEAQFGEGSGPILRGIDCSGYEYFWEDCNFNDWDTSLCSHFEDAGVTCTDADLFPTTSHYWIDGSVRLQGGSSPAEGRVEVYWDGEWHTVCDDSWDFNEAIVVCRQLGYPAAVDAVGNAFFGEGWGEILLDDVECNGYETSLMECRSNPLYQHNCHHSEDAGVICTNSASEGYFQEGSVRLQGSSLQNQGRVEIYHYGLWGTVCDDGWGLTDAEVVCKQLGFPGAYEAFDLAFFGEGENPILLDDVSCDGSEHYLTDCNHNGWYNHNCAHSEDAGVQCYTPEHLYPRLVNGTTWSEGRVEVWNSDHWEGVCAFSFYENEASVVCQQLGFHDVETVYYWEKFGINTAVPLSIDFVCDSDDKALSSCDQYQTSSTYCDATAIKCQQDNSFSGGAIAGISFAVLTFFTMCIASCIIVYRQRSGENRRSSPTVAVISGSENFAGSQSIPYQLLHNTTGSNLYGSPPPSYNDAVSDSVNYLPVNVSSSNTSRPPGQAPTSQGNFIATRNYPIQPNPTVPNANPSTLANQLPTTATVNAEGNRHCPEQTYDFTRQQINDLSQIQPPNTSGLRNGVEDNISSAPKDTPPLMVAYEEHADVGTNKVHSEC